MFDGAGEILHRFGGSRRLELFREELGYDAEGVGYFLNELDEGCDEYLNEGLVNHVLIFVELNEVVEDLGVGVDSLNCGEQRRE